ncbi:serine-type endopeptidase activity protein [Coemansia brasiliensis]|uniref:Serine-type endopeptidase activity protein n=1 Tax=Coemansia brasiliensis TaxID=2650707 RepID=A0A9W8LZS8_9FUNG|nr:serine-type endopeptidase activity protein [Coemansia brasiliensis]
MMFGKIIITCALAFAAAIPGLEAANEMSELGTSFVKRIDRGTTLNLRGFDYIVYIKPTIFQAGITACTGMLLSSRYVLTTQSCLSNNGKNDYSSVSVTVAKSRSNTERDTVTFGVSKVFSSADFAVVDENNNLAVLQLQNDVPASFAKPIKIYAGDYKASESVKLAGFATNSTINSQISMTSLRYEYINIGSADYCMNAKSGFDNDLEICALVSSGINTCGGDYGAPLILHIDNSGSSSTVNNNVIVVDDSSSSDAFVGNSLLGLTSYAYSQNNLQPTECVYDGNMGFFTWLYPFVDQIANLTGLHVEKFTVASAKVEDSPESYMHPEMDFPIQSEAQANYDSQASHISISQPHIVLVAGMATVLTMLI